MDEFNLRRERLFDLLKDNSVAIIFAGVSKICSEDEDYPFYANRHFFYLTGIEQENSVLLLVKTPGERQSYLFVDDHDELKERWTGKRLPFDLAGEISQIGNVYSTNNLESVLEMALSSEKAVYGKIEHIYLDLSDEIKIGRKRSTETYKAELLEKYPEIDVLDIYKLITSLRMIKSDLEVANIVEAINATNTGINDLLLNMHIGMTEHELSDKFEYFGKCHNRTKLAFETICASGKDATIMHHPISQQTKSIEEGELVLFDLGYKYRGYCADISRTYPVNGIFSDYQRKVYEAVLKCNKAVISFIKPGLTLKELQEFAKETLKKETVRLGLLREEDDIAKYYIHSVSHHLGIDTHDASDREQPLMPGCVITVEPGLYFVEKGVGVRIEDDVLVTKDGSECLSKGIKKEIADVEKLLKSKRGVR
ncbi:MAG: Xaa-Pro peptidase family protein [Bacilli bacterium]|nr:Xaa-Pro peptidase family protein [Bacilli bacterium]